MTVPLNVTWHFLSPLYWMTQLCPSCYQIKVSNLSLLRCLTKQHTVTVRLASVTFDDSAPCLRITTNVRSFYPSSMLWRETFNKLCFDTICHELFSGKQCIARICHLHTKPSPLPGSFPTGLALPWAISGTSSVPDLFVQWWLSPFFNVRSLINDRYSEHLPGRFD